MIELVLSPIHYAPSILAATLTIIIAFSKHGPYHKTLAYSAVLSSVIGLVGFILDIPSQLIGVNFHSFHALVGSFSLLSSIAAFLLRRKQSGIHCQIGKVAGVLAIFSLVMGGMIFLGLTPTFGTYASDIPVQISASSHLPEIEAKEFLNVTLTPISSQGNNAIIGTQIINKDNYRLEVSGLVNQDLNLSYDELQQLPAYSEVSYMPCVEGWGFNAKWTGLRVIDLLDMAGVKENGSYIVFVCQDGYSTGLPLTYIRDKRILLAYGLNDVTLPVDRGFPLQLVANSKYGYKWAKWIIRIEVVSEEYIGFWESRGYTNSADVGTFPFG